MSNDFYMKKILLLLIAAVMSLAAGASPGQWRVFNTFDNSVEKVADTPSYTYFLCYGQAYAPSISGMNTKKGFLFRHDKEHDEFEELNASNLLSGTIVTSIDYNPYRKYLLAVYDNGDIDLIRDNGDVARIKALSMANVNGSKNVNSVTFDPRLSYAYLATDFGYMVIDDAKGEVASSFNTGVPLNACTRLGSFDVIATSDGIYTAPSGRPHFSMDDFTLRLPLENPVDFLSLGEKYCAVVYGPTGNWLLDYIDVDDEGELSMSTGFTIGRRYITHNAKGHMLAVQTQLIQLNNDRSFSRVILPDDHRYRWASSWDGREVWFGVPRSGFYSLKMGEGDGPSREWTMTRDVSVPNVPPVMTATGMAYSPRYGVLVNPRRIDRNFTNYNANFVTLLSGWRDGVWTNYSPAWLNPARENVALDPNGILVDPDNPDYVYMGSYQSGIVRLNMKDPQDILHMTHPADKDAGNPGYVKIAETLPWFKESCNFLAPEFDADGNMWSVKYSSPLTQVNPKDSYADLYVWPAENRKASTSASTCRPWKVTTLRQAAMSNFGVMKVLRNSRQRNIIVIASNDNTTGAGGAGSAIYLVDHKGTVTNPDDDTLLALTSFVDQDGSPVAVEYVLDLFEDQSTGLVWVATSAGLFTFNPLAQTSSVASVNRIKVSRNDGTSLADYLLNDARVNRIIDPGQGKKWFAVDGGGILVTSSDGRTILDEITASNSDLPSDAVYDLCYNPASNSMMVSTDKGLAEYYISGGGGDGSSMDDVRIYPNPVRPDYFGYVTIDGLTDNALVKIIDAGGNMVKELGLASGGEVKWDITNHNMRRVPTGVYYVLSSSGPDQTSMANVGKVLVVN